MSFSSIDDKVTSLLTMALADVEYLLVFANDCHLHVVFVWECGSSFLMVKNERPYISAIYSSKDGSVPHTSFQEPERQSSHFNLLNEIQICVKVSPNT